MTITPIAIARIEIFIIGEDTLFLRFFALIIRFAINNSKFN